MRIRVRRSFARKRAGQAGAVRTAKEQAVEPVRCRCMTGWASELEHHFQGLRSPGRRRPRLLPSAYRLSARFVQRPRPLQAGACGCGHPPAAVPRSSAYVRHADGGCRCAAADAAGVDGAPGLQDDADLRRLPPRIGRRADRAGFVAYCGPKLSDQVSSDDLTPPNRAGS